FVITSHQRPPLPPYPTLFRSTAALASDGAAAARGRPGRRRPPARTATPPPGAAAPRAGTTRSPCRPRRRPAAGPPTVRTSARARSEEHTSELQSRENLVCRLL